LVEIPTGEPFVAVGVNYFGPHMGWAPKLWQRFDANAVREHIVMLRQQGFNVIRVFLTLESFHRQPGVVNDEGLSKFRQLIDICRDNGIRVVPSGPDHWEGVPPWLGNKDPFADEELLDIQAQWWEAFTSNFRDEPTILAWDLLNEPSIRWDSNPMREKWSRWLQNKYGTLDAVSAAYSLKNRGIGSWSEIAAPDAKPSRDDARLYDYQLFRESIADHWSARMVAAVRRGSPRHLVTIGHIQWSGTAYLPTVKHYSGFNLRENARHVDFVTIHFYPIAPPKPGDAPGGIDRNAAYLEALLNQCSVGKPIMIGEFAWYGGGEIRRNGRVIMKAQSPADQLAWNKRLLEVSRGRVCGWLNWAFADTPGSTDLTRWSGLWTEDLTLKPWGEAFGRFARASTRQGAPTRPIAEATVLDPSQRRRALTDPAPRGDF